MEHGLIRLINSGGTSDAGFTQTIAVSVGNRLYRVTNNGSANGAPGPTGARNRGAVGRARGERGAHVPGERADAFDHEGAAVRPVGPGIRLRTRAAYIEHAELEH